MNTTKNNLRHIYYSNDVSILDHATMVVYRNLDGLKEAIWIDRYEDTEQSFIYSLELFNKPGDSWIDRELKQDLKSFNSTCDTNYKLDQELNETDQYRFTEDLCSYYGAINFDQYPRELLSYGSLEVYLQELGLIE